MADENLKPVGVEFIIKNGNLFFRSMDQADSAFQGLVNKTEKGGKRMRSTFDDIVKGFKLGIGINMADIAQDATSAVVGFFTGSIGAAGDFEATLNRFSSVAGDSMQQAGLDVKEFSTLFKQMGADTQYSAKQAADAAVELAKGGRSADEVYSELSDTLALASAGELDLAKSAEIAAKQMAIWENTGVKSADVADLLSQAANASTVSVEELAGGLAQAGQVAKDNGLSFEELVTAMAELAPGFASASDAGTSFKAFLNNLQPTTKPATAAMRELNLLTEEGKSRFYDLQGQFIGMEAATQLLHDATKGLSTAERALALETIFGADAQRAAGLLAEKGADGYRQMAADMGKAGSATDQATEKNKGFNFQLETLKGSLETLQISIGERLLPVMTDFVVMLTNIVNGIGLVVDKIGELEVAGVGFGELLKGLTGNMFGLNTYLDLGRKAQAEMAEETRKTTERGKAMAEQVKEMPPSLQQLIENARGAKTSIQELGTAAQQTPTQLEEMKKAIENAQETLLKVRQEGGGVYAEYVQTRIQFITETEQRQAEHEARMKELRAAGDADGLKAEQAAFEAESQLAAESYAAQQAAQRQHLGQMLIDYIHAQEVLHPEIRGRTGAMIAIISEEYGILPNLADIAFGKQLEVIDRFSTDASMDIETFKNTLQGNEAVYQAQMIKVDEMTRTTVEKLRQMKDDGVITTEEYNRALESIPAEVLTTILLEDTAAQKKAPEIGAELSEGVAAGVSAKAYRIQQELEEGLSSAMTSGRRYLQSQSPSKRAEHDLGEPIAEGIAYGILHKADMITDALQDVIRGAMAEGRRTIANIADVASFDPGGGSFRGAPAPSAIFGAPGRASGGFVAAGHAYEINERGTEYLIPLQDSMVLPASTRVEMPATPQQIMGNYTYTNQTTNQWNYSPTYGGGPPPSPEYDFAVMQAKRGYT